MKLEKCVQESFTFSGYAFHGIDKSQGIVIQLGKVHFINHIRFHLRSDDLREYAYRVEVSLEGKEYKNVVNYTQCFCHSWQNLSFPSRYVQYIRLVEQAAGTKFLGKMVELDFK